MRINNRPASWLIHVGMGLYELVFYMPVLFVIGVLLMPPVTMFCWIITLSLTYAIASSLYRYEAMKKPILRILISCLISVVHLAVIIWITGSGMMPAPLVVGGLLGAYIIDRGFVMKKVGWSHSFTSAHMLLGVAAYLMLPLIRVAVMDQLDPYVTFMNFAALTAILLFVFMLNERHLLHELVESKNTISAIATRRRNRQMMLSFSAVLLFIAFFQQLKHAVKNVIGSILGWLFSFFQEEPGKVITETIPEKQQSEPLFPDDKDLTSNFGWIEDLLKTIVIVLVIVGILIGLLFVLKKLFQYLRALYNRLIMKDGTLSQKDIGYSDEVEKLMTVDRFGKRISGLFKSKPKHPLDTWDDLASNKERIRSLYRSVVRREMKRGYELRTSLTPRETAGELAVRMANNDDDQLSELVTCYEAARYGEENPSDQSISKYRSWYLSLTKK